ncbi:polyhydroxyalkanoate biosynthesis repressor PhaR [Firmicutes bacterium AF22-6AC]|nr:polyhydroxyalkanoate biosynthesis repressor PhaR [Firmicutes bacterium AF22-6AC]
MKEFEIGPIRIGNDNYPLVIPEIGINHNGDLDVAKQMVDAAARAGARIVKHQTHIVEDEMSKVAKNVKPGNSDKSIYDVMSMAALSEEDEYELMQYTQSKGMVFLSTPFSRAAADRLESFGVLAYKIGSGELNNYPLIKHIASFHKPMILSTGMNNIASIKKATSILEEYGIPYALMHTTNLYPTKPEFVRLGAMQEMMRVFKDVPIGLSDHTQSNAACLAAVALGANLVERHFTDTMKRTGPDIVCSMDEAELKNLLNDTKDIYKMLGGKKEAIPEEKVTSDFAFATVVSIKPIKKGETFTKENLWVKRPGTGSIPADEYEKILGQIANMDIESDTQITREMIKK